jgi:hypothetical protein
MRVPFIGCLGGSLLLSAAVSYSSADTQHDRRISALEAQLAALQSTVENLKVCLYVLTWRIHNCARMVLILMPSWSAALFGELAVNPCQER